MIQSFPMSSVDAHENLIVTGPREWHKVHDFFKGWGFKEHIPGNWVETSRNAPEPGEFFIPYSHGYNRLPERTVWVRDASQLLGVDPFDPDVDLDKLWRDLQEPLRKQHAELVAKLDKNPIKFERLTVPRFTKDVGDMRTWICDIRQALTENPLCRTTAK